MKKWTLLLKCMKEDVPLLANLSYHWYRDFSVWNSRTILGQRISALVIIFESAWQYSQLEFPRNNDIHVTPINKKRDDRLVAASTCQRITSPTVFFLCPDIGIPQIRRI
jgi:hypothetical protein